MRRKIFERTTGLFSKRLIIGVPNHGGLGRFGMSVAFITLYVELAALIFGGGYAISSLFIPFSALPSISPEQALLIAIP